MNKLLSATVLSLALLAGISSVKADETIYFEDGSYFVLKPGEKIFISRGTLWEFTRFLSRDLRIEAAAPVYVAPVIEECDGFTFGGNSCDVVEEEEEVEETVEEVCDTLTFGGTGC